LPKRTEVSEELIEKIVKAVPIYRIYDLLHTFLRLGWAIPFIGVWSAWYSPGETKTLVAKVPRDYVKIPLRVDFEVYTLRKFQIRWWRDEFSKFHTDSELTSFTFEAPFPFEIYRECGVEATNTDTVDNWLKVRFSGVYVERKKWVAATEPFMEMIR